MTLSEIPLTPDNQQFNAVINHKNYRIKILWRESCWVMDLMDEQKKVIISGIPLITGVNLLAQYNWMDFGFALFVGCDDPMQEMPTKTDLGLTSHLYIGRE